MAESSRTCTVDSYRETLANLLKRLAMFDSVPGPKYRHDRAAGRKACRSPKTSSATLPCCSAARRHMRWTIAARASAVDVSRSAAALTPSTGLITTVRDLAKFDLALKQGILLERGTLEHAWSAPSDERRAAAARHRDGSCRPTTARRSSGSSAWRENASSSLMITLPDRGLTLILMANSDGLVRLYSPANGDITLSPFARLFLNVFVR